MASLVLIQRCNKPKLKVIHTRTHTVLYVCNYWLSLGAEFLLVIVSTSGLL